MSPRIFMHSLTPASTCVPLYVCIYMWRVFIRRDRFCATLLHHGYYATVIVLSAPLHRVFRAMLLQYGFLTFCIVCPYSSLCCGSCAFHVVFRATLLGNGRCSLSAFCTPFYAACFRLSLFHVFCIAFARCFACHAYV